LIALIIEGELTLETQASRKLQQGLDAAKVLDNWKLNKILQRIKINIESMKGIHFQAVRTLGIVCRTSWQMKAQRETIIYGRGPGMTWGKVISICIVKP